MLIFEKLGRRARLRMAVYQASAYDGTSIFFVHLPNKRHWQTSLVGARAYTTRDYSKHHWWALHVTWLQRSQLETYVPWIEAEIINTHPHLSYVWRPLIIVIMWLSERWTDRRASGAKEKVELMQRSPAATVINRGCLSKHRHQQERRCCH